MSNSCLHKIIITIDASVGVDNAKMSAFFIFRRLSVSHSNGKLI